MRTGWLLLAGVLVATLTGGRQALAQPKPLVAAAAQTCDINIDSWAGTASDRTYHAPWYESILTIAVRVNPVTCTWRIDSAGKPSWFRADVVAGTYVDKGYWRGPGVVDIRISKNGGYARGGRIRFASSSYSVPVDISQSHYIGACTYKLKGTTAGEWTAIPPAFLMVRQYMSMPSSNFSSRIVDSSTCYLNPQPHAYTFGMTGAKIQAISGVPRTYQLSRPGVVRNATGEGALFVMSQPDLSKFSGVLALELPLPASLPADLQVTQSLDKKFISFADGGGVVRIGGSVRRSMVPSSTRPCLFTPSYYTVMAPSSSGPWLSVTPESSCKTGKIDQGTLVIAAKPNGPHARVGAIFTPWGSVIFVVQPAG